MERSFRLLHVRPCGFWTRLLLVRAGYYKLIGLLLIGLSAFPATGQDQLDGVWKGTLTQGTGGCYPQYFLELQIHVNPGAPVNGVSNTAAISGIAYDYYDKSHYVKMSFTGRYNASTHRLVLIENRILEADIPADCQPCIKTYSLIWNAGGAAASKQQTRSAAAGTASRTDTTDELNGDWKGIYSEKKLICPPGKIRLKKATATDFPVDIDQPDTLLRLQQTLRLKPREKDLIKTMQLPSPQITIELYDNAEIDGDTVTVFVNNRLLLYRQMLTDKPLTVHFNAFPNTEYELVMYADNLGRIPPNTALMMVSAGGQKSQVFLSSSEKKSAAVRFVYRP